MTTISQVIQQMLDRDMPPLPDGHPILDGKFKRFGPKKKGWYILRELTLKSGQIVISGAFGFFQGENRNTVPVSIDYTAMSEDDKAEFAAQQREIEEKEIADRKRAADMARNRALGQWAKGTDHGTDLHPYLVKKGISGEGVRITSDGLLLVPMKQYSLDGARLVGLQKIDAEGNKLYNKGMDKIGASLLLGSIVDSPVIAIGEGYATCRTVRMVSGLPFELPVVVGFDAGSLIHIAKMLRRDFPDRHLLFLADDDYLLEQRLTERLKDDHACSAPVPVDGATHDLLDDTGRQIKVMAEWRKDAQGCAYIAADVRAGRSIRTYTYENAGLSRSRAAAAAVGNASVITPLFKQRELNKWTDFNDLFIEEDMTAVEVQIHAAVLAAVAGHASMLGEENNVGDRPTPGRRLALVPRPPEDVKESGVGTPEAKKITKNHTEVPADWDNAAPVSGDAEGGGGRKKKAKPRSQDFWDTIDYLLENFVLLYGTSTAWDRTQRIQIKVADIRLAYGSDQVKFWLGNGDRKMINFRNLVFDPTMTVDDETHVNMFDGFKVQPREGDCTKILDLLSHLCDGKQDLIDWILRWTAYPLQHPGAKMASSIIMHGDEGSGKNLFWEKVVRQLYGEHAGVIGNAQIEAPFNEWASQKLFFVCDEVVTRNELRQLKGKLKGLITGDEIRINPKNLPERSEVNHLNLVFLSNELQPLALDKTDRRYLVIWTPPKRDEAYYKDVAAQVDQGGVEAFYYHLMHEVNCSDFSAHTKPPDTRAKQNLISLGLSPPERFYREWAAGALPLPFMTCGAMQLYHGFQRWSHLNGERYPATQTLFGRTVERIGGVAIRRKMVKCQLGDKVKQRTAYLIGDMPEGKSLQDWVSDAANVFETDLRKYRHVYDQSGDVDEQ